MSYQTKLTLGLYVLFGALGLWLGNDGFALEQSERYANTMLYDLLAFMLYVCGGVGTVIFVQWGIQENKKSPYRASEPFQVKIAIGVWITGGMVSYGNMAGPFHQNGELMSPWIILPLTSLLPLLMLIPTQSSNSDESTSSSQCLAPGEE